VVDTPSTTARSKKEQQRLDVSPFARRYVADSIWNWRFGIDPVSKKKRLEMIDFKDVIEVPDGRFGLAVEEWYRVYELIGGKVQLETFKMVDDVPVSKGTVAINTTELPVPISGELGCEPPLYDIARKNIEHFQMYSLLKSDACKTMVPQRVIEGGTPESIAPVAGDVTLFPPPGCKAYFIEPAGTSLEFVRQFCHDIGEDIAKMTASVIGGQKDGPDVTATGEIIDNTQETAELRPLADGFKDTLDNMLKFFAQLMNKGEDAGGEVVLATQWALAEAAAAEAKEADNTIVTREQDREDARVEIEKAKAVQKK
jgi:hypothetical protein